MKEKMGSNNIEAEYKDIADKNAWQLVYQKIDRECEAYPYKYVEAKKPENKPLNRYRDVNPYDHSRIVLTHSNRDYINANLVKMERANRKYILTQGPLAFTVGDFWLMVWQQGSRAIIMLNKVIEKNVIKCYWYWPHDSGEPHRLVLQRVKLVVEQLSEEDSDYYVTRKFKIIHMESGATREVTQFHYTTWPDFGVPSSPVAFLEFLKHVRASGLLESDVGPPVVHCSAGIGRSGTFCLVDSCLVIIEKEGLASLSVQEVLLEMRRHRMGLIQTPQQLRFSYLAIIQGAKRLDPDYEEQSQLDESIYSTVSEAESQEESAPPPPPRGESLARPPLRPLPAIPTSTSLGDMKYSSRGSGESSSSESGPPTPPPRLPAHSHSQPHSSDALSPSRSVTSILSAEEEELEPMLNDEGSSGEPAQLRRRKDRELANRVAAMKRKSRDADQWHTFKRSLYKPLTITAAVLLASVLVYTYVKH